MASNSLQSSLNQYEQLVKKQLSFTEDSDGRSTPQSDPGADEGVFDKPLTEERQQGMRAVQSTLERLDSKHGVLQRHASAECVRDASEENDYLKRTMSDSIRRSDDQAKGDRPQEQPRKKPDTTSEPSRSRQGSGRSDVDKLATQPSSIPQAEAGKPQMRTPLTTKRTVPMNASSSPKTPDHTKPVKAQNVNNNKQYHKDITESPDKAPSMRQLLVESKAETSDLKRQINELITENDRLRGKSLTNGHSSADSMSHVHGKLSESERRCDNLLREKENMATELWKLRQQVEELMNSRSEFGSEMGEQFDNGRQHDRRPPPSEDDILDSYRSENPDTLNRRIVDLESQVLDLQEANDTASAEVLRLDQENQMLTGHIKRLTTHLDEDVDAERELLHQQISELKLQQQSQGDDEVLHLRSEMAQLRIDLKAMQQKSDILQDENNKLRESLREIKATGRWKGSGASVNENHDRNEGRNYKEAAWDEINDLKQRIREYSGRAPAFSTTARSTDKKTYVNGSPPTRTAERPTYKSSYNSRDINTSSSAYNSTSQRKDNYRSSYQPSNQSSDDRAPSPSGKSDISESTTVLMAGFEAYKPLSRNVSLNRSVPTRKIEDDRISECTMDILNEATFNTQAYGAYDVNDRDSVLSERIEERHHNDSYNKHVRRGSVGSSSVHSESTQDLLLERLAPPPSFGLRSVIAPVLPTQHNKANISPGKITLSTAGRRPFAPRSPADLAIGDIAKFTKPDGRICRGTVKFIGHIHDKNDTYVGLELEFQDGKHDGMYDGVRYFDCKPNRGAFITFNKVIMVWGS